MKLCKVSPQIFWRESDKILTQIVSKDEEILRTTVAVLYRQLGKREGKINFQIFNYSLKNILWYILWLEKLPEDLYGFYYLEIEEIIQKRVPEDDRELFLVFLESPATLKEYLLLSTRFFKTTEEYFGWLKQPRNTKVNFKKYEDLKYLYNPILHSRVRGYRDKGSLGSQFIGHKEWQKDYLNRLQEEERETKQQQNKDAAQLLKGFLQ